MEPSYISELREEIKSELQKFSSDYTLKRLASVFLSYKIIIIEFAIATILVSELFFGLNTAMLGGISNLFLFSMFALLILIPINAIFSYIHFKFYKKRWTSSGVNSKITNLIKFEMEIFVKNLCLENSSVNLPDSNFLASLAYFSQEFLLFGPRNETVEGNLDDISVMVHTSQDYLGYEGRLLVVTMLTNRENSDIQCDISYQEKEYNAYGSTKKLSNCLTVPEIKEFITSFFETFSLRSQGWIKIAKNNKSTGKVKIDIIIDDYLPLSATMYTALKKYLKFFGKPFLDFIGSGCNEKHNI